MWVFYLISLPLTLGMVSVTLRYFAGPGVPRYVLFTVGYTWFCSISIIILVPADIWTTIIGHDKGGIAFFWSWSYWSTFLLTWAVVPLIQGYEDAGDFTLKERLKTSIRENLVFYLILGAVGLFGLILLLIMHRNQPLVGGGGGIVGFAMACSNTFGLVTGAFLLGFGLSEIPKNTWRNADWTHRQKVLSHRVAKMAVKLDDAHQELSNAIVVAQATSNQMSKRDPLRPYMNVIDAMVKQMFHDDPSFKPSGGRLGENDMDYDTDEQSMATLRRQLRITQEEYYRYKSEYMTYVTAALELEDTMKNYERRELTGWKYVSSFRPSRPGTLGAFFDIAELIWRCILQKQFRKLFAIILGCMSAAILLAEATLLPRFNLSFFSMLINAVGEQEVLVQISAFVPLMYMCICTYYSLFKIGMLMFYSFTPRQTSSVSLLMICSMVARYAPPISYNFLNLISLGGNLKTTFEKRMGNIDDAVPFFGQGFNKIYPLIMVVYTLLVASNFFGRIFAFLGSWKRFRFQNEEDETDGLDPSGVIILQKERSWLEQGQKVGEQVIPLARNFLNGSSDIESGNTQKANLELKEEIKMLKGSGENSQAKVAKVNPKSTSNRETIANKYASLREQQSRQSAAAVSDGKGVSSASVSLLEPGESKQQLGGLAASGISSTWASMKSGLQNFKANLGAKKFLPIRQANEQSSQDSRASSESLDDIFQRLKQRPSSHTGLVTLDDDEDDDLGSGPNR